MFHCRWTKTLMGVGLGLAMTVSHGVAEDPQPKPVRVTVSMKESRLSPSADLLKGDPLLISRTVSAGPGETFDVSLEMGAGLQYRWFLVDPSPENFANVVKLREDPKPDQVGTGGDENLVWRTTVGKGGTLVFLWGLGKMDRQSKKITVPEPHRAVVITTIPR